MLPRISGEFGVVFDPDVKFSEKGTTWVKIRGVAKDRVRDSNGTWTDGDPLFIDIVCFGRYAENLAESVAKGDSILVDGTLQFKEWTDNEGVVKQGFQIRAEKIGVSTQWTPAKSQRVLEQSGLANVKETLGGTTISTTQEDVAPF